MLHSQRARGNRDTHRAHEVHCRFRAPVHPSPTSFLSLGWEAEDEGSAQQRDNCGVGQENDGAGQEKGWCVAGKGCCGAGEKIVWVRGKKGPGRGLDREGEGDRSCGAGPRWPPGGRIGEREGGRGKGGGSGKVHLTGHRLHLVLADLNAIYLHPPELPEALRDLHLLDARRQVADENGPRGLRWVYPRGHRASRYREHGEKKEQRGRVRGIRVADGKCRRGHWLK